VKGIALQALLQCLLVVVMDQVNVVSGCHCVHLHAHQQGEHMQDIELMTCENKWSAHTCAELTAWAHDPPSLEPPPPRPPPSLLVNPYVQPVKHPHLGLSRSTAQHEQEVRGLEGSGCERNDGSGGVCAKGVAGCITSPRGIIEQFE
jgi:hypothetical protein